MYPHALKSPYGERRSAFGKERYNALGIAREDWEARQRAAIANWNCFGAPAALFCYIDRDLGRPGGPFTPRRADPLLRHVDRPRGPQGERPSHGPRPARGDVDVRRRLRRQRYGENLP
jgi:hypothetical protein